MHGPDLLYSTLSSSLALGRADKRREFIMLLGGAASSPCSDLRWRITFTPHLRRLANCLIARAWTTVMLPEIAINRLLTGSKRSRGDFPIGWLPAMPNSRSAILSSKLKSAGWGP